MINKGLLKHPLNWFTVWLMLIIAAIAGHYFLTAIGFDNPYDSSE